MDLRRQAPLFPDRIVPLSSARNRQRRYIHRFLGRRFWGIKDPDPLPKSTPAEATQPTEIRQIRYPEVAPRRSCWPGNLTDSCLPGRKNQGVKRIRSLRSILRIYREDSLATI